MLVRESFVTALAQDGTAAPYLHGTSFRWAHHQGVSDTAGGIRHNGHMDLTMIRSGVGALPRSLGHARKPDAVSRELTPRPVFTSAHVDSPARRGERDRAAEGRLRRFR